MKKSVSFLSILLAAAFLVPLTSQAAADCQNPFRVLDAFKNRKEDYEKRSHSAKCLVHFYLGRTDVGKALLSVLKNQKEDILLREDIMELVSSARLRKTVKVEEALTQEIGEQEQAAVNRTLASANHLLAVTQAVKSMDEVLPLTHLEHDFFRSMSEIAVNESNHVTLRTVAIESLERMAKAVVNSGVYDERSVKLTYDTLREVAISDETSSYYLGAASAFERFSGSNQMYARAQSSGRSLSSEESKK